MQKSMPVVWVPAAEAGSLEQEDSTDSAPRINHALLPFGGCGESTGFASAAGPHCHLLLAGLLACCPAGLLVG